MSSKGFKLKNIIAVNSGGFIGTSENEQNIQESLNVILSTQKGMRPGIPDFGCAIINRVFDQNDPTQELVIRDDIISAIETWEPRVEINAVELTINPDTYEIGVQVDYSVIDLGEDNIVKHEIQ